MSLCGWLLWPQLADQVGAVHSVFVIGYSPSLATLNLRTFNELQIGVSNLTSWCHGVALVSRGNIVWLDSSLTFSLSLEKMLATSLSVIYVYGLVEIIIPGYHGHGGYLRWLDLLNWMEKKKKKNLSGHVLACWMYKITKFVLGAELDQFTNQKLVCGSHLHESSSHVNRVPSSFQIYFLGKIRLITAYWLTGEVSLLHSLVHDQENQFPPSNCRDTS